MIIWLVPVCMFFLASAIFFGGMYDVEDGNATKQTMGLAACFVVFMGVFWGLRMIGGAIGFEHAFLAAVAEYALPVGIPTMLTGRIGVVVFRLMGVRMVRVTADAMH